MNATAKEIQNVEPAGNPAQLLQLAVERNLDVDKLGQLMELQERWEARQAKRAFFDSLKNFQANLPPIKKTKIVMNKDGKTERYRYAPLDEIISTLKEPLRQYGFSYRWGNEHLEDGLRVTCYLTHEGGHEESSSVNVPKITGYGTNAAQDEGSANTYGRRYSFANVTGITIEDDDDGESAGPENAVRFLAHQDAVRKHFTSLAMIKDCIATEDLETAAACWFELDDETKMALWLAPTKGGIFTTEERTIIKTKEFREAHYGPSEAT